METLLQIIYWSKDLREFQRSFSIDLNRNLENKHLIKGFLIFKSTSFNCPFYRAQICDSYAFFYDDYIVIICHSPLLDKTCWLNLKANLSQI